jgi:tRNA-2-methylthio-N6-dimethylallyladenosine synthase
MEKVKFDSAFTFKYSSRPGTKAAEYSDQIPEKVKKDRLAKLVDLQYKHTLFRNRKEIGKKVKVLVEKESKKSSNEWAGRTDNNKWVIFPKESAEIRDLVDVKIVDAQGVSLFGEIIQVGKESHAII